MKPKIDWEKMTVDEAQVLADELASAFSLTVKCYGLDEIKDVEFITVVNVYDDNFHAKNDPINLSSKKTLE